MRIYPAIDAASTTVKQISSRTGEGSYESLHRAMTESIRAAAEQGRFQCDWPNLPKDCDWDYGARELMIQVLQEAGYFANNAVVDWRLTLGKAEKQ